MCRPQEMIRIFREQLRDDVKPTVVLGQQLCAVVGEAYVRSNLLRHSLSVALFG